MKLLHVKQARSIWLFDVADLNPSGADLMEDLIDFIKERYEFANASDYKELISKAGAGKQDSLSFQRGSFQFSDDSFIEVSSLAVHNDGIVADTVASTEVSDQFAKDLLVSVAEAFDLPYEPSMIRARLYSSTLVVQSEIDLRTTLPGLSGVAASMSEALVDPLRPFQPAGLAFWTDPNDNGAHKTFTFVPQVGRLLSERRYFSEAPLQTSEHLRMLSELEDALTKMQPPAQP